MQGARGPIIVTLVALLFPGGGVGAIYGTLSLALGLGAALGSWISGAALRVDRQLHRLVPARHRRFAGGPRHLLAGAQPARGDPEATRRRPPKPSEGSSAPTEI